MKSGPISEERILQVTNDIAEGECRATKRELIAVAVYWRDMCERWNQLHQKRMGSVTKFLTEHLIEHLKEPHP